MSQALRPTSHFDDFASLGDKETQPEESKNLIEDEQKALAYMSRLKGWKILKEYIERIEEDLDKMVLTLLAEGADYEEIGKKTAVKEIVKNVTRNIKQYVEDAKGTGEPTD